MTEKTKMKVILLIMMMNVVILVAASEASAQERIDDWYGREFTELHQDLKESGDKFKFKNHGNGKQTLTMTDFRGVKCEYISLDYGYTVLYRVDHYSLRMYKQRVQDIKETWQFSNGYYILRNTVVAMLDHKNHRIGFARLADLKRNGYDPYKGLLNTKLVFNN